MMWVGWCCLQLLLDQLQINYIEFGWVGGLPIIWSLPTRVEIKLGLWQFRQLRINADITKVILELSDRRVQLIIAIFFSKKDKKGYQGIAMHIISNLKHPCMAVLPCIFLAKLFEISPTKRRRYIESEFDQGAYWYQIWKKNGWKLNHGGNWGNCLLCRNFMMILSFILFLITFGFPGDSTFPSNLYGPTIYSM